MTLVRYNNYPLTSRYASAFGRSPWAGLENEINRLFETALTDFAPAASEHRFPVDLYEDRENNYVRAELPGLAREDISVEMVDGYLTINGSRKVTDDDGKVAETISLSRSIAIPEAVQADKVAAAYENGVLTVTLPKREEAKPRKVTIDIK
ncbi:MAG: Hsp20/alpha crystallin family protein [Opitutaceae bacterium]|nr:Hsp20/alpha crystallin family protein [Opitutaceae bacterium]